MIRKLKFKQALVAKLGLFIPIFWKQTKVFNNAKPLQVNAIPVKAN